MNKESKVITFGCRLNTYESEIIKDHLKKSKLINTVVINTCAVTKEAEKEAKQSIRKIKRQDPSKNIIVTGCAAQRKPEMFELMSEVDKVLGNEEKLSIESYILNRERRILVSDIMSVKKNSSRLVRTFGQKVRAFIEVQNGCNHRCTFCAIPYSRGNNRSVPIEIIAQQIRLLLDEKYHEIVFTGVDITAYGSDLPGKPSFAQMIRRIFYFLPDLQRLRLSSIDIAEIDKELFDLIAYNSRIMPHFHISIQAGDNIILKRMKRRHSREEIIKFCNTLRYIRPEVSFGADIIAGFPTETNEMFENTKRLISEAGLQYLHIFPYSEREGTPATKMPQVPISVRKERAAVLRAEGTKELYKFFTKHLNKELNVLVESNKTARTENFIPVKLDHRSDDIGKIIKARLYSFEKNYMLGKVI